MYGFVAPKDAYQLPDYEGIMDQYGKLHEDMKEGRVLSAYALDRHGLAAAVAKMVNLETALVLRLSTILTREISLLPDLAIWYLRFRLTKWEVFPLPIQ